MMGHSLNKVIPSAEYPFWEKVVLVWTAKGELKFAGPGRADCTFTLTSFPMGADGFPDRTKSAFFSTQGGCKMVRVGLRDWEAVLAGENSSAGIGLERRQRGVNPVRRIPSWNWVNGQGQADASEGVVARSLASVLYIGLQLSIWASMA